MAPARSLRTSLWPIPVLCVLVGLALSFATVALDPVGLVPARVVGGPDAALAILGAIAASMITLTGIVLTIVLVVVQLAMGQFSPRIVRAILYDRPSQFAIKSPRRLRPRDAGDAQDRHDRGGRASRPGHCRGLRPASSSASSC